jgi:DNA-binding IclR family transcriptional regulator
VIDSFDIPEKGSISGGIQVINRAARILRALRDEPEGLSLGQIARRVDLPRSTVQRIVGALVSERLLMAVSPNGRVRLGTEILALAASLKTNVVELAHPLLKELSSATGETVDLSLLRQEHLVFVDQVIGTQRLRAVSAVGETFPLVTTANGKASLAALDPERFKAEYLQLVTKECARSGKSLKAFLDEIAEIRRTGVAVDLEEHSEGIAAVGTAFTDSSGMVYAISVPSPANRFAQNRWEVTGLLVQTRKKIEAILTA